MTGTEEPKIATRENPGNFEHSDIFQAFSPLDPTTAQQSAQEYTMLAHGWNNAVEYFAARIKHSSQAAWEGAAAEASRTAISNYTTRALELSPALNALATEVTRAANGVVMTKQQVHEPKNRRDDDEWLGRFADWVTDGPRSKESRDAATAEAREAMRLNYVDRFTESDGKIPVFPAAVNPASPLYSFDPASNPGGDGSSSGPNSDAPATSVPATTTPATDQPATTDPGATDDESPGSSTDDSTSGDPGTDDSTTPASTTPDSPATTPTSTSPAGTSTPGSGSPGTGSPGGAGTPGGGSPSVPGPGRATPGTPSAGGAAAVAAGTGAGAGRGMPGMMGGMGAPGARGGQDDESTHDIPEWLRNAKNTEELLGELPKTLPGGVIGADE
ncbi:hypothetical protein [Nocardia sp. NPDC023988]|uniref:hypothetical protein n=1 Tax=unclassified Nocardia TaxID=2637762 RepID=UPI0033D2D22C